MAVVLANGYVYAVPYVPTPQRISLKTAFPSGVSKRITCRVNLMKKTPEIGRYLDAEEKAFIQAFETSDAPLKSGLTPERKLEIEAMARAAMTDEPAKISLRIPKRTYPV